MHGWNPRENERKPQAPAVSAVDWGRELQLVQGKQQAARDQYNIRKAAMERDRLKWSALQTKYNAMRLHVRDLMAEKEKYRNLLLYSQNKQYEWAHFKQEIQRKGEANDKASAEYEAKHGARRDALLRERQRIGSGAGPGPTRRAIQRELQPLLAEQSRYHTRQEELSKEWHEADVNLKDLRHNHVIKDEELARLLDRITALEWENDGMVQELTKASEKTEQDRIALNELDRQAGWTP